MWGLMECALNLACLGLRRRESRFRVYDIGLGLQDLGFRA